MAESKRTYEITIDGKACTAEHGEFLWDVAKRNGIYIPVLCRNDAFPDHRACCRVCIVEVEIRGRRKVVTSCVYPVEQECAVYTDSPRIREERAVVLALLAARAPESDAIAQMAQFMASKTDDPGSFKRLVSLDAGKCVLCGLCVQACESLGTGAISTVNRGTEKEVNTPYAAAAPTCVGCLSCANVCPTGAIEYAQDAQTRSIWNKEFELAFCESCGALMGTREALVYAAKRTQGEPAALCDNCRRKALADVMAQTYRMA